MDGECEDFGSFRLLDMLAEDAGGSMERGSRCDGWRDFPRELGPPYLCSLSSIQELDLLGLKQPPTTYTLLLGIDIIIIYLSNYAYGRKRIGSRGNNDARRISGRPRKNMTIRFRPKPPPAWGGQP